MRTRLRPTPSVVIAALLPAFVALSVAACKGSGTTTSTGTGGSAGGTPVCTLHPAADPDIPDAPLHTPRWAFEPWISKDISDGPDTYAFVKGFEDRSIPVGVVVLDSPWETNYNTLVPNPTRYPDFGKMVSDLHAKNIRLVLWLTAFVNSSSFDLEATGDFYPGPDPDHDAAADCGYFIDKGTDYGWWKGQGGSVDFFNKDARAWWHRRQDPLYAMGVDGFKLDFGDSYVPTDPVQTAAGPVAHQAYSEAYYHDFYTYGRATRGDDFLTMVRAYDKSYQFDGRFFAKKEDAPVTWMGDNRRDDIGLADALDEMFRSSAAGYAVVGSDIGGYLDRDDKDLTMQIPFDSNVFARWTAVAALTPFMQLHGRANITPWTVEQTNDQITNLYRYWAVLHHELVPFFYSLTEEAYAGGSMPLKPIGAQDSWPGDYRYELGNAFLVAPPLDGTGKRDVVLPVGKKYYDFFDLSKPAVDGGQTLKDFTPGDLAKIPLFIESGAIIPLAVGEDVTSLGSAASAGKLTVLAFPDAVASTFTLHEEDGATTTIGTSADASTGFQVTLSRTVNPTLLRVRYDGATMVTVGGVAAQKLASAAAFDAATDGFFVDDATHMVWIHVPKGMSQAVIAGK